MKICFWNSYLWWGFNVKLFYRVVFDGDDKDSVWARIVFIYVSGFVIIMIEFKICLIYYKNF